MDKVFRVLNCCGDEQNGISFPLRGGVGREQGRSYDDDPPGDDLTVRMPLPKLPRK